MLSGVPEWAMIQSMIAGGLGAGGEDRSALNDDSPGGDADGPAS